MLAVKDTEESKNAQFAVRDIERRARAAYRANKRFFADSEHLARVDRVDSILRTLCKSYLTAYRTARAATRRRAAHTEVKYDRVTQYETEQHEELREWAVRELDCMGLDLVYKPRTNSYSVHVF
jgi:hypothetical protein